MATPADLNPDSPDTHNGTIERTAWIATKAMFTELYVLANPLQDIRTYGAVGGGENNDADIVSLFAYCASTGATAYLAGLTLTLTTPIVWDFAKHAVDCGGAILNYGGAGAAITAVTAVQADCYGGYKYPFKNFRLDGPGKAVSGSIGIQLGTTNLTYGAFTSFQDYEIAHFETGITWGSNAWLNSFVNGAIRNCGWAIIHPSGVTNSGENVVFDRTQVFNNDNGIKTTQGYLNFSQLSCDYNTGRSLWATGGGCIRVHQFHLENNTDTDYWIVCDGGGQALIEFDQAEIVPASSSNKTAFPIGLCSGNTNQIHFGSLNMLCSGYVPSKYAFGYLINGHGSVRNLASLDVIGAPVPFSSSSLLLDGGFELNQMRDWVSTGDGAQASTSSTLAHTGTYSMRQNPSAGQSSQEFVTVKCQPGAWPQFDCYLNSTSNVADHVYITMTYLNQFGQVLGSNLTTTITTPPTSWTRYSAIPAACAPAATAYARVQVEKATALNGTSDGNGQIYWDDCYFCVTGPSGTPMSSQDMPPSVNLGKTAKVAGWIPKGTMIESLWVVNNTANAITGGLKIGSTDGGSDYLNGYAIAANAEVLIRGEDFDLQYLKSTGRQKIWIDAVTGWNSANISFTIYFRRISGPF